MDILQPLQAVGLRNTMSLLVANVSLTFFPCVVSMCWGKQLIFFFLRKVLKNYMQSVRSDHIVDQDTRVTCPVL